LQSISTHGANIPVIGYGTWNLPGEPCTQGVARALEVGYRHIDTAAGYKNEDRVGEGIRASGVPRDDIFLTTKVGPENLEESAFKRSAENSLKLLGVDQVDLLLIHWPSKTLSVAETIKTLNEAKKMGWTRHIGVSNFTTKLLAEAWEATEAPLVTNQCEYHPYLNQDKLLAACRAKGMAFTAFSHDHVRAGIRTQQMEVAAQFGHLHLRLVEVRRLAERWGRPAARERQQCNRETAGHCATPSWPSLHARQDYSQPAHAGITNQRFAAAQEEDAGRESPSQEWVAVSSGGGTRRR
jgi:diketogulonate reductase-like aldo/keto reductase